MMVLIRHLLLMCVICVWLIMEIRICREIVLRLMRVIWIVQRQSRVGRVIITESVGRCAQRVIGFWIIKIAKVAATATSALKTLRMSRNHFALPSPSVVVLFRQSVGLVKDCRDMRSRLRT